MALRNTTMHAQADPTARLCFNVADHEGTRYPAVEYWAAAFDEDQPAFQVVPLARFIKLLGSNEPLMDQGNGTYRGLRSGRRYVRVIQVE